MQPPKVFAIYDVLDLISIGSNFKCGLYRSFLVRSPSSQFSLISIKKMNKIHGENERHKEKSVLDKIVKYIIE